LLSACSLSSADLRVQQCFPYCRLCDVSDANTCTYAQSNATANTYAGSTKFTKPRAF